MAVSAWTAGWGPSRDRPGAYAAATVALLALWCAAAALVLRARRPGGRWAVAVVLAVALGARLALVPAAPDLSGDVHRYVWDGRVQAEGINPYRYAPEEPHLARLRDEDVYPRINRKPVPTIYPPVAQAAFLGLNLAGARTVAGVKLAISLSDVLAAALLALLLARLGIAPERSVLYAWHPLAIVEVGRSGHIDAVAVLLLVAALLAHSARRPVATGALGAAAALVKFPVAVALPALAGAAGRRRAVVAAAAGTVAVAYLPYLGVGRGVLGYLPGYLEEEGYESGGRFHLLARLQAALGDLAVGPVPASAWWTGLVLGIVGTVAVRTAMRPPASTRDAADRALLLMTLMVALATPTYPWYLLPLAALLPLARPRVGVPAAVLCGLAPFLYLQWWTPGGASWPLDLTWGAGAVALAGAWTLRRRPGRRLSPWPASSTSP